MVRNRDFFRKCREEQLWPHQVAWARFVYQFDTSLRDEWTRCVVKLVNDLLDAEEKRTTGTTIQPHEHLRRIVEARPPRRRFPFNTSGNEYRFIRIRGFNTDETTVEFGASGSGRTVDKLSLNELRAVLVAMRCKP